MTSRIFTKFNQNFWLQTVKALADMGGKLQYGRFSIFWRYDEDLTCNTRGTKVNE